MLILMKVTMAARTPQMTSLDFSPGGEMLVNLVRNSG